MTRAKYRTDTPERILEVAIDLFAERGHRAVTLQAIVQEAKVNAAAVNYHFGDKDGLYRAVIEHALELRETTAPIDQQALLELPPRDRLRRFILVLMRQLLDENSKSRMAQIMLWEAVDPTPLFAQLVDKLPKRQITILNGIVRDIVGPSMPDEKVERASISILGQCVYYRYGKLMLGAMFPGRQNGDEYIEGVAEDIYQFSIAALDGLPRR
jgi:AcrR family transcriptional regulator